MLEPWNDASILPPVVNTTKINKSFHVAEVKHACNNISKVLTKQSPLHREAAILSRFLYKFDKKFRNDIGYRNFRKVNTALRKYLKLNLLKDVENFTLVLPNNDSDYVPTRQMLEYVLIRIMTFSKLMVRIYVCSKQSAIFYLDRIKRADSHWMSLMPYALLSRVWSMSSVLLQHSVSWYTCLHNFTNKLTYKGVKFLPEGYTLPEDIKEWLDLENLDNFGRMEWSRKKPVDFHQLLQDDEGDAFDSILGYVNDINEYESTPKDLQNDVDKSIPDILDTSIDLKLQPVAKIDHGVAISRESFILYNFKNKLDGYIHSPEKVINITSLHEFIDKEERYRNEDSKLSLTQHISLLQWHALKNTLHKVCTSLSSSSKIQRKFQKIWKEKCLDYI